MWFRNGMRKNKAVEEGGPPQENRYGVYLHATHIMATEGLLGVVHKSL